MTRSQRLVAVTGINGFVGTHTALKFLQEGWRVRGSVRSEEKKQIVLHNPVFAGLIDNLEVVVIKEMATGNVADFLDGCSALAHVSPENLREKRSNWAEQRAVVINDTNGLFKAVAASPSLQAVVVVSAQRATHKGDPAAYNQVTDEECEALGPTDPGVHMKWYTRTKVIYEQIAVEWQTKTQASWSLARYCPVIILGSNHQIYYKSPREIWQSTGDVTRITDLLRGEDKEMPPDPPVGYVDARDLTDAVYIGINAKLNGRFIIQGGLLRWAEMADGIKRVFPHLVNRVPKARLANEEDVEALELQERVKVGEFERATGFTYRTLDETVLDAMGYMVDKLGLEGPASG